MEEGRDRVLTTAILVAAVALLLGCLAGALAGGVTGFLMGRRQGEAQVVRKLQQFGPLGEPERVPEIAPQITRVPESEGEPFGEIPRMIEGALVQQVTPDTPAEEAGLRPGDIITGVDEVPIDRNHDLRDVIREYRPGDEVEIRFWRDGGERSVHVTLGENPDGSGRAYLGVRVTQIFRQPSLAPMDQ